MRNFSFRPLPAMLWELWRASRGEMLARVGIIAAFATLFATVSKDLGEAAIPFIRGILIMLTGVGCVFSTTWLGDLDNQHTGFTFRLGYTRPVSTLQLVLVPMAYSAATAMCGYLVAVLLVYWILGQWLPLLGPALIFGSIVCASTAVIWSSTHTAEKLIAFFAAALALVGVLAARHSLRYSGDPILLAIGKPDFFDLAWHEYLGLFLLSSLSLVATVFAVGYQRYGEGFSWGSFVVRAFDAFVTQRWWVASREAFEAAIGPRAFRSPVVAQIWFEWRRTVILLFVSLFCCTVVLGFVVFSPLVNDKWGGVYSVYMWLCGIALTPFIYQLMATDAVVGLKHKQGSTHLSLFEATRPLRCDQLIAIKLVVVAGWSVFGFLVMALLAIAHTTLAGKWQLWGSVNQEIITGFARLLSGEFKPVANSVIPTIVIDWKGLSNFWWLAGLSSFILLYFSTTAMFITFVFAICKYQKVFTGLVLLATASLGLWAWDTAHGMPLRWLWLAYGYLIPVVLLSFSLYLLKTAVSAGYLSRRYFAGVFCLWGIYVTTTIMLLLKVLALAPTIPVHPIAWLFAAAFLLAPLASAAAAPLALASFRHG